MSSSITERGASCASIIYYIDEPFLQKKPFSLCVSIASFFKGEDRDEDRVEAGAVRADLSCRSKSYEPRLIGWPQIPSSSPSPFYTASRSDYPFSLPTVVVVDVVVSRDANVVVHSPGPRIHRGLSLVSYRRHSTDSYRDLIFILARLNTKLRSIRIRQQYETKELFCCWY